MRMFYILVITSLLISGCFDPEPPPKPDNIIKYTVESNIDDLSADINYCDNISGIVLLEDEDLPWEIEMTPEAEFRGTAYLKAVIPEDVAFVPYDSGDISDTAVGYLIDTSADFISSGVSAGDRIYKDPEDLSFVMVDSVEDEHTLKLKSDYYKVFPESYYIYHLIRLNVVILHNDDILIENTVEGYKRLESLVQSVIAE